MPRKNGNDNGRKLTTPQSVNAVVKAICDIMRRSNCAGAQFERRMMSQITLGTALSDCGVDS